MPPPSAWPTSPETPVADIADITADRAEAEAPYLLAVRKRVPPPPDGHCLNCADPVFDTARFCDADCRSDWERAQERRRINTGA